ncbi:MAG: hypothetical protein DRP93_09055 [Candidatus Neomarinimicrobiota bacterium]|nr:MAG: hypothetical protein DRP93_09055 [Candidatus Neomarinimicrobiota bacterium]
MCKDGIVNNLRNVSDFISENMFSVEKGFKVDEDYSLVNIKSYLDDMILEVRKNLCDIDNVDENLGLDIDVDKFEFDRFGDYIDNDVEFKFFSFYKEGILVEERDEKEIWVLWDFLRMENNYDYDFGRFYDDLLIMINNKYEYDMIKFSS